MLEGISLSAASEYSRRTALIPPAEAHRRRARRCHGRALRRGQWLGSFAVYLVTNRGPHLKVSVSPRMGRPFSIPDEPHIFLLVAVGAWHRRRRKKELTGVEIS